MAQERILKLKSTKSSHFYYSRKNKKQVERKIELKKYDPTLRKRVLYKETKK